MEIAQDRRQSAHMVGVGMRQGYGVKMADAASPKRFRHTLFADVKILRGLVRAAAKSAAIDKQSLAVRRNQKQGIALAYVDRLQKQGIVGMLDGPWSHRGQGCHQQRGP